MGVSHNRWYVERKFASYCDEKMDEQKAKRLAIEFRADSENICLKISMMEASISVKRTQLHPLLVKTLGEICK